MRNILHGIGLLGGLLTLAACGSQTDPLYRDGLWEPTHSNRSNLVLMVANPTDLVRGTGRATADGQLAAAAVDRLRNDKVKKLSSSDIAAFAAGASGANDSGGGGGTSGTP